MSVEPSQIEAALNEFRQPSAWQRNIRGNISRTWEGNRVTVFFRQRRHWYCINHSDPNIEPEYSTESYASEDDAIFALAQAVVAELI